MQWGVYIHIPFCRQKCFYCDFPSFAGRECYREDYVKALCQEILMQGVSFCRRWGKPTTIYMGGGTPTALLQEQMQKLLLCIANVFGTEHKIQPMQEFTVECNPGTVDLAYLQMLHRLGVNRLSFGVQSFNDVLLKRIGRIHTSAQAKEAVTWAKQAGFTNFSLDLMYGLPGQTLDDLKESVREALVLTPKHISIYGLQLEAGTVFARQQELGKLQLPDDEATEAMYDYMTRELPAHGYARYEISNFAQPGFESRHNLSYWQDVPYLGLGSAAHSYLDGQRYEATTDIVQYIEGIRSGKPAVQYEEEKSPQIAMEEFAFLALRTAVGIDKAKFQQKFGCSLHSIYDDAIKRMVQKGLLAETPTHVHLTELGMKYGNWVFEEFLL